MEEWGNASWPVILSGLEKEDRPLEELKLQLEKQGMRDFQQEHQGESFQGIMVWDDVRYLGEWEDGQCS